VSPEQNKPQGAVGQAPKPTPMLWEVLDKMLNKWMPVQLDVRIPLYHKDTLKKNGLLLLYPMKKYSIPAQIRFIAHPDLTIDTKYYYADAIMLKKNEIAVARFTLVDSPLTKLFRAIDEKSLVLNIELLPPKRDTKPRHRLLIVSLDGKEVGSGAAQWSRIIEGKEWLIWIARNVSGSYGTHWVKYYVFMTPINKKVKIEWNWHGQKIPMAHEVYEV